MPRYTGPLLTHELAAALVAAHAAGERRLTGSFDLGRTEREAWLDAGGWVLDGTHHPWPTGLKERSVYVRDGDGFSPLQRFGRSLIKLVPTDWGAPTFEIDGIKMLPTAQVSPYEDALRKVALVHPAGARLLDTCGGLGYFAAGCLAAGAAEIVSFEKNPDVLWLREHNPWSPDPDSAHAGGRLRLQQGDVSLAIQALPERSFDALLHDPPRFGIAGELYSQAFYDQLARVARPQARLFHYVGTPNAKTSGRDVPAEVARRLERAGFATERVLDGIAGVRRADRARR